MELETKEIQKDGVKFGRDSSGKCVRFKREHAASRIIGMMSEVFSPNGEEKSGVPDKWSADCPRRRAISYISDYKDNYSTASFVVQQSICIISLIWYGSMSMWRL